MSQDEVFQSTVNSLFKGMDSFLSTKTVVGEPIEIGDTIIIPLVDVSFGVGAGAFNKEGQRTGAGGMGGKMTPSAVLVIHNGMTRIMNISTHTGMDKLLDMVPDFVDTFRAKFLDRSSTSNDKARAAAAEAMAEKVMDASEFEDESK